LLEYKYSWSLSYHPLPVFFTDSRPRTGTRAKRRKADRLIRHY